MRLHAHLPTSLTVAVCAAITAGWCTPSLAAPARTMFGYQDWAIACDNTRHCEAVGYQADDAATPPVAMWIARDAGPETPLTMRVLVMAEDKIAKPGDMTIGVPGIAPVHGRQDPPADGKNAGTDQQDDMSVEMGIDPKDAAALLPLMLKAEQADVMVGQKRWVLSLRGLNAVLLKMDDSQGRLGTPGALVRKGQRPESGVLPPLPKPRIVAAPEVPTSDKDCGLLEPILAAIKTREPDCWEMTKDDETPEASLSRLSTTQVLVMRECGRGAYQASYQAWIVSDKPPYDSKPATFEQPRADISTDLGNASFDGRFMESYWKGRGLADCASAATWAWTGKRFALVDANNAPLCKGIAGGGFTLRLWTADVQK